MNSIAKQERRIKFIDCINDTKQIAKWRKQAANKSAHNLLQLIHEDLNEIHQSNVSHGVEHCACDMLMMEALSLLGKACGEYESACAVTDSYIDHNDFWRYG